MDKEDVVSLIEVFVFITDAMKHTSRYAEDAEPNTALLLALQRQHEALMMLKQILDRELPDVPEDEWPDLIKP